MGQDNKRSPVTTDRYSRRGLGFRFSCFSFFCPFCSVLVLCFSFRAPFAWSAFFLSFVPPFEFAICAPSLRLGFLGLTFWCLWFSKIPYLKPCLIICWFFFHSALKTLPKNALKFAELRWNFVRNALSSLNFSAKTLPNKALKRAGTL